MTEFLLPDNGTKWLNLLDNSMASAAP